MRSAVFSLLLVGALGLPKSQEAIDYDSNVDESAVQVLTATNWDRKVKAGAPMMVSAPRVMYLSSC